MTWSTEPAEEPVSCEQLHTGVRVVKGMTQLSIVVFCGHGMVKPLSRGHSFQLLFCLFPAAWSADTP